VLQTLSDAMYERGAWLIGRRGLREEVGRILLKGVSGGSGSGC